jgi:hypothetical protein
MSFFRFSILILMNQNGKHEKSEVLHPICAPADGGRGDNESTRTSKVL